MKSTGVVRKIDDLGRIVIPKEIRKTMGIREDDNIKINVKDDVIELTKVNMINNYIDFIDECCSIMESLIEGNLIITNRDKIVYASNNINVQLNNKVSQFLIDLMDNRQIYNDDKETKIEFSSNIVTGNFLIYPIIDESSSLGLVILYNKNQKLTEYENLIKYLARLLSNKLDISC